MTLGNLIEMAIQHLRREVAIVPGYRNDKLQQSEPRKLFWRKQQEPSVACELVANEVLCMGSSFKPLTKFLK